MQALLYQTRIAVLWIGAAVAMSAHMILLSFDPTAMKKAAGWAETAGQGEWFSLTLFWLVPLWMAFLAVTLRNPVNRRINCAAAVIFTMAGLWHFFICGVPLLKGGPYTEPVAHHVVLLGSAVVATVLVSWYAWKWPRAEA